MKNFFSDIKEEYEIWNEYCNRFDLYNTDLKYKYGHSLRVSMWCHKIKPDKLAKLIGLYHDVARFPQYKEFKTFNDSISIDHGIEGGRLTEELLKRNSFFNENKNIITTAITYHNALTVPCGLEDKELEYLNILRDADKLDILNTLSTGKHRRFDYSDNDLDIRESVNEDFFSHRPVNNKNFKNRARTNQEECIQILAYCYDLNYAFDLAYPVIKNMYMTLPSGYHRYIDEVRRCITD